MKKLLEVSWDTYGAMLLKPASEWPPFEVWRDVGQGEALEYLREAVEAVLRRAVAIRSRVGAVEVLRSVTEDEARAIVEAFKARCDAVARERARIAKILGDPREVTPLPTGPVREVSVEVEEEAERWRREIDATLERYRWGVHGS